MTLHHTEGFETHNTTALLTRRYPTSTLTGVTFGSGRLGWGSTWKADHTVLNKFQTPLLPVYSTWIIGFAIKITGKTTDGLLVRMKTALGVVQCCLTVKHNSGTGFVIEARQGDVGASVYSSGTTAEIAYGSWTYIEVLMTISTSGGLIRTYKDGVLGINKTSINTANGDGSNQNAALFEFGGQGFGSGDTVELDDMYCLNQSTGTAPYNNRLGEVQLEGVLPNSDGAGGAPSEWTPSTGSTKNTLLADADDATFITAPANDLSQAIGFGNLVHTTGDVLAVHVATTMQLSASGSRNVRVKEWEADGLGAEGEGVTRAITNTTPQEFQDIFEAEPSSGDPWTASKVNADAFGAESLA